MNSLLLLQIEDRTIEPLQTFLQHNKKTCELNKVKYVFIEKSDFQMPPYWQKIYELDKCMTDNPKIQYVMWLDSDAFLVNFSRSKMQAFFDKYKDYSVIISRDMPPWEDGEFNAGSFLVKNDEMGKTIVKDWMSKYNSDHWKYENSKWTTETAWAGEDYEQGAFVKHILNNSTYKNHIMQLPYHILNNNTCNSNLDENISVHLAAKFKEDANLVDTCMKNFIAVEEGFSLKGRDNNDYLLFFAMLLLLIVVFVVVYYKSTRTAIKKIVTGILGIK
jgi:hypothetical protein